ncbi:hypothetical protein GY45DRAFT_1212399, partial [Cubamyces sp. BRFM 1775]
MITVEDALALVHQKENEIRALCFDFDESLYRLRETLHLPYSPEQWCISFTARLKFLNKEYRRETKNNLQALSTRLRHEFGQSYGGDALASLKNQIVTVNEQFIKATKMMDEFEALYLGRMRDEAIPLRDRVLLYRAIPRLRRELQRAADEHTAIQLVVNVWGVYFSVLASEPELNVFLEHLHLQKLTKDVIEGTAGPVFDDIIKVGKERDAIILQSSRLGLEHEAMWLAQGGQGIREREFRREIAKYDDLKAKVAAQRTAQTDIVNKAVELTQLSTSPATLPGPGEVELKLDQFFEAYKMFVGAHAMCRSMQ